MHRPTPAASRLLALPQELPESLSCLVELKALGVGSNELRGPLPEFIGACTSLRLLDISSNKITVSQGGMGKGMVHARGLPPACLMWLLCLLPLWPAQSLPASLGNLVKLKTLKAVGNKLTSIPEQLRQITGLQVGPMPGGRPDAVRGVAAVLHAQEAPNTLVHVRRSSN